VETPKVGVGASDTQRVPKTRVSYGTPTSVSSPKIIRTNIIKTVIRNGDLRTDIDIIDIEVGTITKEDTRNNTGDLGGIETRGVLDVGGVPVPGRET
jgi:hypothetical protein